MLVEVRDEIDVELVRLLIRKYHGQGIPPGGGAGRGHRYFVWLVESYVCAVAWLHDSTPFRFIAEKFRIPTDNSYFIRRICKTCPGDHLVAFLNALADKLASEGKEVLWTLGLPNHSNILYKLANFQLIGYTTRTKHPVYVRKLR